MSQLNFLFLKTTVNELSLINIPQWIRAAVNTLPLQKQFSLRTTDADIALDSGDSVSRYSIGPCIF